MNVTINHQVYKLHSEADIWKLVWWLSRAQ